MSLDDYNIPGLEDDAPDEWVERLLSNPREVLCQCEGMPAGVVLEVIRGGATSLGEVTAQCGAGIGCSSCHAVIAELIERHAAGRLKG